MLRQFKYMACAAVVGLASQATAVSVVPASEPCGDCHRGPTKVKYVPSRNIRVRWVAVDEGGHVRLVLKPYRATDSGPATELATMPATADTAPATAASEASASGKPATSGAAPSGATTSAAPSADGPALANRAQALLRAKCARCHGGQTQESGLDLRSRESILKGGESGPGVIPGRPDESLVLKRVSSGEMPPTGPLSPADVATLKQWIATGAPERAGQP